jgi:hypothetical protein
MTEQKINFKKAREVLQEIQEEIYKENSALDIPQRRLSPCLTLVDMQRILAALSTPEEEKTTEEKKPLSERYGIEIGGEENICDICVESCKAPHGKKTCQFHSFSKTRPDGRKCFVTLLKKPSPVLATEEEMKESINLIVADYALNGQGKRNLVDDIAKALVGKVAATSSIVFVTGKENLVLKEKIAELEEWKRRVVELAKYIKKEAHNMDLERLTHTLANFNDKLARGEV